jgi:hypothetical protein
MRSSVGLLATPRASQRGVAAAPGRGGARLIWELLGDKLRGQLSREGGAPALPPAVSAAAQDNPAQVWACAQNTRGSHTAKPRPISKDDKLFMSSSLFVKAVFWFCLVF